MNPLLFLLITHYTNTDLSNYALVSIILSNQEILICLFIFKIIIQLEDSDNQT